MTALARIEDRGDRLVVINDNPSRRNALSDDLYSAIHDATARAGADPRLTSVTLCGAGGFFCSGGDLTVLAERRRLDRPARLARIDALHDVIRAIRACRVPVIAAVDGGAAGAGASIAFACDLIVATEDAAFTAAYVKAGLVPDGGLTATLGAALPPALAARLLLLGEPISATRLEKLGALSAIAPPGAALQTAMVLADRLAAGPAEAQSSIKALLAAAGVADLEAQLDREREAMADAVAAPEAAEGIAAFLDKRFPDFIALRGRT